MNIVVASYSQFLSTKHSIETRNLIQSDWYKALFPNVILSRDQNTKNKFITTARGSRMATSIGGSLTGEGADILIVDDPITPLQALSKTYRDRNIEWFEQTFMSRLNDRKRGIVVVVMHRLHTDDLSHHLLSKNMPAKWKQLSLPIINESPQNIYSLKGHKLLFTRPPFTPLNVKQHSLKDIKELQMEVGSYTFAAQYQQTPINLEGGLIKNSWFKRHIKQFFANGELIDQNLRVFQSWDTANSAEQESDYSVCITIINDGSCSYIYEIDRNKLAYPQLKEQVVNNALRWKPCAILIENKASGQQLLQELKNKTELPIIGITPRSSKMQRVYEAIPFIESGKISLPYSAYWLSEFETEALSFPQSKNDDQLDSLTQYILWHKNKTIQKINISSL